MKHRTRRRRPFLDSLRSMIESAESLDRHFIGFTKGVVDLTETLAATMSLPKRDRRRLRVAALLHDIGRARQRAGTGWPHSNSMGSSRRKPTIFYYIAQLGVPLQLFQYALLTAHV